MSRLSMIAHPDVICITNVGTAHIGELGSRENILKSKVRNYRWYERSIYFNY